MSVNIYNTKTPLLKGGTKMKKFKKFLCILFVVILAIIASIAAAHIAQEANHDYTETLEQQVQALTNHVGTLNNSQQVQWECVEDLMRGREYELSIKYINE